MVTNESIYTVKRYHNGHFFDIGAMRSFKSRTSDEALRVMGGGYVFVTSEKFEQDPRLYTVRYQDPRGSVHTVGDFQAYANNAAAWRAAREFAAKKDAEFAQAAQDLMGWNNGQRSAIYAFASALIADQWTVSYSAVKNALDELAALSVGSNLADFFAGEYGI